ncbi:MAG: InlB B-repeat-containing protein [Alphaproteobacteria bacterium]
MRKFISIIFISLFCSNVALAAITCTESATDECEVGCYYSTAGCMACDNGKYTDTAGSTSCSNCHGPQSARFTSPGTSVDDCSWKMTCDAGEHYVSDTTNSGCKSCPGDTFTNEVKEINGKGYGTTQSCKPCGANSTANSDHTNCNCKAGYHFTDSEGEKQPKNTDGKDCEPDIYTITYESNNGENKTETQKATYNSPITLLGKDAFERDGYQIESWQYNADNTNYIPGTQLTYTFTSDITLTAQWKPKTFTITYIDNSCNEPQQTQSCSYDSTIGCPAASPTCELKGYHFLGWECESGCPESETIKIGTNISNISGGKDMTLTAVWEECPVGHYCENIKTKKKCPAGSTSDAGSMQITNCYIQGGITKICDEDNQCFILPDSAGDIYYHGGDN